MEFNPLPDLLNIGFTVIEIALFYGGKHMEAKLCRFLTMTMFTLSKMATFENTSNTSCVLLILPLNIEFTSQRTAYEF